MSTIIKPILQILKDLKRGRAWPISHSQDGLMAAATVGVTGDESSVVSRARGQHCPPGVVSNSDFVPRAVGSH